ncbi:hypothetical protein McanMca71_007521 [Microsporum canis]|uniref:Protein kinase domain-containing protein n=1 Tax=Arthroderma otae (strain ATCC MYA-4605 / CBS 113480) TaxID=554155 RepID=C5FGD9_ARTOC|nr:conserved hypothetical protein [Microsporum canis CBS 113480]EEQ29824.1 conserved hypothetical protein [Microsporum canis CBS 113480]
MNSLPRFSITEFWFDAPRKESRMTVRCKGRTVFRFAEVAEADDGLDGLTIDDFQDWAIKPFLPLFRDAEPLTHTQKPYTLYDYLNPETFYYSLLATNDTLVPFPGDQALSQQRPHGVDLHGYKLSTVCHSYQPMQVQISSDYPDSEDALVELPEKVLVDGKTCFFKPLGAREKRSALRELECYKRIRDLQRSMTVRVPVLYGVVQDNSRCLGLLLSWVDCRYITLECALRPNTPRAQNERWASQLATTLRHLHNAGIVWGDVKPANVLVDVKDDIWIVDFGGGYTRGWVGKDKAGTIEGDIEGLMRINDFLSR